MAVNFMLRKTKGKKECTIYARVTNTLPKIDWWITTDLKIIPAEWNTKTKRPKHPEVENDYDGKNYNKIDRQLSDIKTKIASLDLEKASKEYIETIIHQIVFAEQIAEEKARQEEIKRKEQDSKNHTLVSFTEQYIQECESGKRKKKRSTTLNVSAGTIKSYKGFLAQLKEYENNRFLVIGFEDVTMNFYNDFTSFLNDKQYSPNTIARMIKICKTMMHAAKNLKLTDGADISNTDFAAVYKEVDNVYLTDERIQDLYKYDLSKNPAWEKVRDVFVVGCLTGQRVSDYKRIESGMIVTLQDGKEYIKIKQQKTGQIVYPPLDSRIKAILNKYDGSLPKVYDQKINDYIKKIAEALDWTEKVSIEEQKGGLEYTTKIRFCELIKTHTARRSFATNMYKAGASLADIIAITGHASEQQLKTYLKLTEEEKAMQAAKSKYFTRLKIAE